MSKTREWSTLTDNVDMTDVFTPHAECENPRVVLVEGNPAIGKTAFCQKLSHDWSLNRIPEDSSFPKVEILLLLKCRDVNVGMAKIQEAIDDQLLPEDVDRSEKENLFRFISAYQSRILLILDGLDELKCEDLFQRPFLPLIQGKVLSNIHLLLTARPEMGEKVKRYCDSLLQIVGYTKNDAIRYIDRYFRNHGDPSLANTLKDKLGYNDHLLNLTSSPMNTSLLCLLCEERKGTFPTKQTELYECLVKCAIRRYFAKRGVDLGEDDPSERCRDQLNQLGKVALKALLENRLYFSKEEMKSEDFLQLFFVTREPSRSKIKPTECYAFSHKTFQEYFAALYLANEVLTYSNESEALLLKVSPADNWQVWKFLFSLVAKMDREKAVFLVSCLGVPSRHAIPEPRNDITKTTWFKSPQDHFSRIYDWCWPSTYRPYGCIVDIVVDVIGEWEDFHVVELNDWEKKMAAKLAECISLDELTLYTPITRQILFLVEYLRGSCTLRKLALALYDETFSQSVDISALARALQSNGVPLTHLNLDFFLHGDKIAEALSEVLESSTTLTHLCLTFSEYKPADPIGPSGASALARALSKNSTLKCLLLASNSIEDQGAIAFADALQTNSTLTQLDLSENDIGDLGIEAICKALQFNHVMTHLGLDHSFIDVAGGDALAGALQSPATQLSHLDLAHCKITFPCVESLAGALQVNRSLTY